MMLLCCSFASASFTSRSPSSLSVDHLNYHIYAICSASLIATPSGRQPNKRFTKKHAGSKLYRVSWLFLAFVVTSISCASFARSSLLQILNSSCRHSVLMLLFFVERHKQEIAFWHSCSMHAVIQVPPDGVVGSHNYRCHLFVACTDDVTVCFSRQTISALTSGLSKLFCIADTLLIASCLLWLENWLHFLPPPVPNVCFASMEFGCHSNTFPA